LKTLYLLRHAKSSWDDPSLADHERPLAARGRDALRRLERHITKAKLQPQLVLCSSALRARETYEALAGALGEPRVSVEDGLYGAGSEEILERVRGVAGEVERLLVVGHNPGLAELVTELAGQGEAAALAKLQEGFPTGALATLTFEGAWRDLERGCCRLADLVAPRGLPSAGR
jgi:phosphohistidine phosphatase